MFASINAFSQEGYSSASHALSKQRSNSLMIPKPSEIVLEEFFNYHRHQIPLPSKGYNVGMDMRWGNPNINALQNEAILQIGFTTHKNSQFIDETPLNICLVIDRSGSMSGSRIEHARQSALALLEKLRQQDYISIVTFDHEVEVLMKYEPAVNKNKIKQIINSISVRGSTDLNSGLIKGYEIIAQKYQENANNKVLLLTDVLTNTGEVDIESIVKNATNYSQNHQIGITLVAIGVQINDDLARQITKSGKHSFHYVNDAEDIKKVFVDEVESIFSTIAKTVELTIEFDDNLELIEFYGYSPKIQSGRIKLQLNNMNAGLTQVVLAKFKSLQAPKMGKVQAKISYLDVEKRKTITQQQAITLQYQSFVDTNLLKDNEVRKCISIAEMATCLKQMAITLDKQSPEKSDFIKVKDLLDIQIGDIKKRYQEEMDKDVKKVLSMLENYANVLNILAKN
jgi:Ca-activated chloride channel homolog